MKLSLIILEISTFDRMKRTHSQSRDRLRARHIAPPKSNSRSLFEITIKTCWKIKGQKIYRNNFNIWKKDAPSFYEIFYQKILDPNLIYPKDPSFERIAQTVSKIFPGFHFLKFLRRVRNWGTLTLNVTDNFVNIIKLPHTVNFDEKILIDLSEQ